MALNKKVSNKELNNKLDAIINALASMDERVSALEKTPKTSAKTTTTKAQTTKKATKKSSAKKTATKTQKVTKGVSLADFEPCTFKGTDNYVWNGVRGYKAMRSAYCYAKQTNGKAKDLAGARKLGITIDFDKAWNKAKAEFEKKYVYVKAADRQ